MPDQRFEMLQDTLAQLAVGDVVEDAAEGFRHSTSLDEAGGESEVLPDSAWTKEDPHS